MRKKIAFCITNDITYDRRILRITGALEEQYEISVISRKIYTDPLAATGSKGRKVTCWFNRGFLFYAEYNLRLLLILLASNYDVVVAVDYDTLVACGLAKKVKGNKLVFDAHEYFEESVEIVGRPRIRKFWKWVGRRFVPMVDSAYTVSKTIAREYSRVHGVNFETIRNLPTYQDSKVVRPSANGKKIILYQGVLNQGRRLELLIKAAEFLSNDYEVWIIGEGDLSKSLKQIASEKVLFHSWVAPERLTAFTVKATLAYNLLDSTSKSYFYSLANKFFDYMHAGVPSINNKFPEYLTVNERYNCCFTEDIETPEALAKFIVNLSKEPRLLAEKSKNAKIAAIDMNWNRESTRLLEIFEKL